MEKREREHRESMEEFLAKMLKKTKENKNTLRSVRDQLENTVKCMDEQIQDLNDEYETMEQFLERKLSESKTKRMNSFE